MDIGYYNRLLNVQKVSTQIIYHVREQNMPNVSLRILDFVHELTLISECLEQKKLLEHLEMIYGYMDNSDFESLADYLETFFNPFLGKIICTIWDENASNYSEQMKSFNKANIGFDLEEKKLNQRIKVEPSLVGANIPTIMDGDHAYRMCSMNNPYSEGELWARKNYDHEADSYIVLGMGFAYHLEALCNKCTNQVITAYEGNLEIIEQLIKNRQLSTLWNYNKFKVVYDPGYKLLLQKLKKKSELVGCKFVVYRPSLRLIECIEKRKAIENYFQIIDGINNAENELSMNFNANVISVEKSVWELKTKFAGKKVIIVGAGPSVESQYEELLDITRKSKNIIIMAVGTIAARLIENEIIPDYVVFSDPTEKIAWQYKGLQPLPVIILSTAYKGVSEYFSDNKYIALQENYGLANELAKKEQVIPFSTGGSVTTLALDIAIKLGAREVLLAGVDLSYVNGRSHADILSRQSFENMSKLAFVTTNNGGEAFAPQNLVNYRTWIENRVRQSDCANVRFYSSSYNGARIKGVEYKRLDTF